MSNIWEEFDKAFDTEALQEDVKAASEGSSDFKEVPEGTYEVTLEKLELGKSKKGDPMMITWFKILEQGPYQGQLIFYYQMMTSGYGIHFAGELLCSLDTGLDIKFETFGQWHQLCMDVKEKVSELRLEFALEKGKNDKGFDTYVIKEVFEADGPTEEQLAEVNEDDIPF